MSVHYSLREVTSQLGGELVGNDVIVNRVASLSSAKSGQISFFTDSRYQSILATTGASAVILSNQHRDFTQLPRIITENPYAYFAKVAELLNPRKKYLPGIAQSASIHASTVVPASCTVDANSVIGSQVSLGEDVVIGPGCIIGDRVSIGNNTVLQANVTIYHDCLIGNDCNLLAGVVIGADGFGYAEDDGRWVKIPQLGRVVLEDFVDVGANTTIDRGALDDTVIEQGVKLDNLIQIGHNCRIGAHTVIAGCVGIAGSACIGKRCRIGGAAMILGHLDIADGVTISPGSMITRSLTKTDTYTALMPFQTHENWLKTAANIRRLGDLAERIKQLENEIATFKVQNNKTNHD